MSKRANKNQRLEKKVEEFQTAKIGLKIRFFVLLKLLYFVNSHFYIHLCIIFRLDLLHNCLSDRQKYCLDTNST